MELIIGLVLGAALLYFWLLGHWFARVLVFPLFAGCLAFFAALTHDPVACYAILLAALLAAWFLAGLPIYYRRYRFRQWCANQRARGIEEYRL